MDYRVQRRRVKSKEDNSKNEQIYVKQRQEVKEADNSYFQRTEEPVSVNV